jgi:predicted nucleic acid-binding Zn ribbon protein
MQCPGCHSIIPDGSKFCGECGAALSMRCPSCGAAIRANTKFCAECGQKLSTENARRWRRRLYTLAKRSSCFPAYPTVRSGGPPILISSSLLPER